MNIAIRYDKGLGNAAVYARLLGGSGFWDFTALAWSVTETTDCRVFMPELTDSSTTLSWYQSVLLPPDGGPYAIEYVNLASGDVIGNDISWYSDGTTPQPEESATAQIIQFLLSPIRAAGVVLSNGTVEFFAAGTSNPKTVWLDRNKANPAANPYTLDANGTAHLYGDGIYRIVIKDVNGAVKYDRDDLSFVDNASNLAGINSMLAAKVMRNVSDYADLAAAVAAIGSTPMTLAYSSDITLTSAFSSPATLELLPLNGATIYHGANSFDYKGSTARWPDAQVLSGTGTISGLKEAKPVWWGAINGTDASTAIQRTLSTGLPVEIPHGCSYTAKNLTVATPLQILTINGTLTLPAACADNDTIIKADAVHGIRIVGRGTLDGNKAAQSGAISQQLIRLTGCNDATISGLTFKKNYSGATSIYAAVYLGNGLRNRVNGVNLYDWSKEGVFLDVCSHSSVTDVIAVDVDGDSWSAVQVGGAGAVHNRVANVTTKNTGASGVGLDSMYSTLSDITVDGVRFQNGVNLGHTGKPASYSAVSNITVKNLTDNVNANSAGLNIGGGSVDVTVGNLVVDGSTQRGVNIGDSSSGIDISNVRLRGCVTAFAMYKAGRVSVKNLTLSGTITTGISKDNGATSDYTTLILDTCDLTAATTKISGAAAGLTSPYIAYQSSTFNSAEDSEGSISVAALGAGGTVTVTNANARSNSRIILEASNAAGASALPFISTQSDGSFVITTVSNGGAGAFVRWKIV